MKPSIVNWAYIGLVYLLLNRMLDIIVRYLNFRDYGFISSPVLSIVIIIVSTVAVFGLVKKISWARIVTFCIIGVQGFLTIRGTIIMSAIKRSSDFMSTIKRSPDLFIILNFISGVIVPLAIGVSLLLLAYKLYKSEPLKIYLSKPQPKFKE